MENINTPPIQTLDLNSLSFLLYAGAAILIYNAVLYLSKSNSAKVRIARKSPIFGWLSAITYGIDSKSITIALLNLVFLTYFISGTSSFLILAGLFISTYVIGQYKLRSTVGNSATERFFIAVILGLWVLLFLAKDPNLVSFANPFHYFPLKLIGVSFIFFRCINYIEDIRILPKHGPITYFAYLVFFPTLIAGPLERCDRWIEDFKTPHKVDKTVIWSSLNRIANGFIKKFILADFLYPLTGFGGVDPLTTGVGLLWLIFLLQLFVLYLDFSGYTDMMIGIARLMGFKLGENFNRPFASVSVQEFWSRWHISLTSFIKDYVFTPLLRFGLMRVEAKWAFLISTFLYFVTMMIFALWHGTTWGFVIFGLLHGAALVLIQVRNRIKSRVSGKLGVILTWQAPRWLGIITTYLFVSFTMIFWSFGVTESIKILSRLLFISA